MISLISGSIALAAVSPHLLSAGFAYVIGGVFFFAGREDPTISISLGKSSTETSDMLYEIDRLSEIVDNNFNVITKRLNEIEKKQNSFSKHYNQG